MRTSPNLSPTPEREQAGEAGLEELRAKVRRGIEQAERRELLDGDAIFDEIRHLSARRRPESNPD